MLNTPSLITTFPIPILLFAIAGYFIAKAIHPAVEDWVRVREEEKRRIERIRREKERRFNEIYLKYEQYRKEGFEADPELDGMKDMFNSIKVSQIEQKFRKYEEKVMKLKQIERELGSIKASEWCMQFSQLLNRIEQNIKRPEKVKEVESDFSVLKRKIREKEELEKEKREIIEELEKLLE